jgi:hypothetical protein
LEGIRKRKQEAIWQSTFSFPPPLLNSLFHSVPSRSQAFVHHDPGNLQPEPFRQFSDAHGEPLKLKAADFHD